MLRSDDLILHPGEFHFTADGGRVRTLLGSCVSITAWHPRLHIGGICHYMIPRRRRPVAHVHPDGRYATEAVQLFLAEMDRYGTMPHEYEVKMFGGGDQFPGPERSARAFDVPRENVEVGLSLLEHHGFELSASHLGGTGARHVIFDLGTGEVWLRHSPQLPDARSA